MTISPDDESRFRFEMSITKMTSTVDYPDNTFKTPHHRNLKTVMSKNLLSTLFIKHMKVVGALVSPNGTTTNS
jgi:hypothetical protein